MAGRIMTTHSRGVSATIDPVKLDRLAEVAVKVGLQLQPGQDLVLTAPIAALPLARRIAEHAYKAGAGLVTPIFSDEEITLARYRFGADASFDRAAGWLYEGMAKAFADNTARLADRAATIPCCCRRRTRPRWRAPTRPIRSPTSRRWKRSPASTSTGTSSPIRASPGPSRFSGRRADEVAVGKLADAIFAASRVDGDDPSRTGRRTMRRCAAAPNGSTASISTRCISPARAPI